MHIKSVGAAVALALMSTSALLSTSAMAADLPSRRAPPVYVPPPIPVFTWTGLYVGVQAGYEFGRSSASSVNNRTGAGLASNGASPDGVIGGAHVGYLWSTQGLPGISAFGSGGVIGVEGDVDGSNYKSSYLLNGITASDRQAIQGSIRGRFGVAVDRVLFYATGGAAFGGLQNNYYSALGNETFNHTRVGWTAGGGVEYAFTNNWSARVEYRYTDFGTVTDTLAATAPVSTTVRRRETDNRVQAGLSYRFDTFSAPVVARY
jgi:outer membrane immunogenic protein